MRLVISKNLDENVIKTQHAKLGTPFVVVDCEHTDYEDLVLDVFGYFRQYEEGSKTMLGLIDAAKNGVIFFKNLSPKSLLYEDLMNVYEKRQYCRAGNLQPIELKTDFIVSLKI